MTLKRVDELKPGDRIKMKIGSALITAVERLPDDRTMFTFGAGTQYPADNDLTVAVVDE
jgi:hypothetical protein